MPNTRVDALDVSVAVNVIVPGTYVVRVGLVASNGATTTQTRQVTLGSAGTNTVVVRFTADALRGLGVDGPYRVAPVEITFLGNTGTVPADRGAVTDQVQRLDLATGGHARLAQLVMGYAGSDGAGAPW